MTKEGRPIDNNELRHQILSPKIPKSEREWWAKREIERLQKTVDRLVDKLEYSICDLEDCTQENRMLTEQLRDCEDELRQLSKRN